MVSISDSGVFSAEKTPLSEMETMHIGNPESIEAGRAKFGNTCLFCHGPKGAGSRAPTLVSNGFAPNGVNDNEYFITTIKYGRPGTIMGAFEGTLTETEMWQVIAYLRDQAEKVAAKE
jgi:mono/diheme cytochrome c family protein